MLLTRKKLSSAIIAAIGVSALDVASADIINLSFDGWFTVLDPTGDALENQSGIYGGMSGWRTAITGTMSLDTYYGSATGTIAPFTFLDEIATADLGVSYQAIGDGVGGPGTLVLMNTALSWLGTNDIPVSVVLDASGLFGAIGGGLATSDVISGVGAVAATESQLFQFGKYAYTLPMGPLPMATTTFNTMDIGTPGLGTLPSGTLPLTDDGIGGSPLSTGPFPGFNLNFDFTSLHVDSVVVPLPAALWLFGSGLIGLLGVARRKQRVHPAF